PREPRAAPRDTEPRRTRRTAGVSAPSSPSETPAQQHRVREHRQQPPPLVSVVRVAGEADDTAAADALGPEVRRLGEAGGHLGPHVARQPEPVLGRDRKSTRLNSSHVKISYAVFCLKKKRKKE